MRTLTAVLGATLTANVLIAAPAHAGTGASPYCFDGTWTDVPILSSPMTVGVETHAGPDGTWITVCYATSEVGFGGGQITGGFAKVYVSPSGASGHVQCQPDTNPAVAPVSCVVPFSFSVTPTGGLSVIVSSSAPVSVGATGLTISPFVFVGPGVSVVPRYPCIYLLGAQVVPGCGSLIV